MTLKLSRLQRGVVSNLLAKPIWGGEQLLVQDDLYAALRLEEFETEWKGTAEELAASVDDYEVSPEGAAALGDVCRLPGQDRTSGRTCASILRLLAAG